MPGKQMGMSETCYPDSLIGALPNLYYYAANNPSEATIAKRRVMHPPSATSPLRLKMPASTRA